MEDRELLRQYAESRSEAAFTELVSRHVNIVYSSALRMVGDAHLAKDIAQTVFIGLARKPGAIRDAGALGSWLYRATHNAAAQTIRTENRRRDRETEAMNRAILDDNTPHAWDAIGPSLDEALNHLEPVELDAVVLRFFEGKSLREAGQSLALTENAVQKRVTRALEKLRLYFERRGVTASTAVLSTLIATNSAQAAPPDLAASLARKSLASATKAAVAGSLANTLYATAKAKLVIAAAVVVAAAAPPIAYQYHELTQLNQQLATAGKKAKADATQISQDKQQIAQLQTQLSQFTSQTTLSGKPILNPTSPVPAASALTPLAQTFADLMNNPAMRESFAADARKTAQTNFADIIKHFNLSPEERDQFLTLLTDREMKQIDPMLDVMGLVKLPPDQLEARFQQVNNIVADSDAQIKEFLNNDDDYAYFQTYFKQRRERGEVDNLNTALSRTGQPLDLSQTEALANLMYAERSNFRFTRDFYLGVSRIDPSKLSNDAVATYVKELQELQNQIAAKVAANGILTTEQLAVFKQNQSQALEADKAKMKMSLQVLGIIK